MADRFFLRAMAAFALAALAGSGRVAVAGDVELLTAEQAFGISVRRADGGLVVDLDVALGYWLYQDRLRIAADDPRVRVSVPRLPAAVAKYDKALERNVALYGPGRTSVAVAVGGASVLFRLQVAIQGCALAAGVCYPPVTKVFRVPAFEGQGK